MKWLIRKKKKKRKIILRPTGNLYNLEQIYHQINEKYFNSQVNAKITWFGRGVRTPKSSITFGSYNHQLQLIKINRLLDTESYPEFFVRYIIYHEMLHNLFPPKRGRRGRRDIHHMEFKEREKDFEEYEQAKTFVRQWKELHFNTCR